MELCGRRTLASGAAFSDRLIKAPGEYFLSEITIPESFVGETTVLMLARR